MNTSPEAHKSRHNLKNGIAAGTLALAALLAPVPVSAAATESGTVQTAEHHKKPWIHKFQRIAERHIAHQVPVSFYEGTLVVEKEVVKAGVVRTEYHVIQNPLIASRNNAGNVVTKGSYEDPNFYYGSIASDPNTGKTQTHFLRFNNENMVLYPDVPGSPEVAEAVFIRNNDGAVDTQLAFPNADASAPYLAPDGEALLVGNAWVTHEQVG